MNALSLADKYPYMNIVSILRSSSVGGCGCSSHVQYPNPSGRMRPGRILKKLRSSSVLAIRMFFMFMPWNLHINER